MAGNPFAGPSEQEQRARRAAAQQRLAAQQAKSDADTQNWASLIGGVLGGAAGGFVGGPAGIVPGFQAGKAIGKGGAKIVQGQPLEGSLEALGGVAAGVQAASAPPKAEGSDVLKPEDAANPSTVKAPYKISQRKGPVY